MLIAAGLACHGATLASPAAEKEALYVPDEVLVRFAESPKASPQRTHLAIGARHVRTLLDGQTALVQLPKGVSVPQAVAYYESQPTVVYAEPNYYRRARQVHPNDPLYVYGKQRSLTQVAAPLAWGFTQGSGATIIAILDTGVDWSHPEFAGRQRPGLNTITGGTNAQDDDYFLDPPHYIGGHGTHVAGIAAGAGQNAFGMAGVDWNATLLPIKVLDADGFGTVASVSDGITFAADYGAHVINLSLGGGAYSRTEEDAVHYAARRNRLVVAAAGNDGLPFADYPAGYVPAIAVGAVDPIDQESWFTHYGPDVDIAAPGEYVMSTLQSTRPFSQWFYRYSGTSMATPFVSGALGLILARTGHGQNAGFVRLILENNTDFVGTWLAGGRLNVGRAVQNSAFRGTGQRQYNAGSYTIRHGSRTGGGLTSLHDDDNNRLVINSAAGGGANATVQLDTSFTVNRFNGVVQLDVTIVHHGSRSGDTVLRIQNHATGQLEYVSLPREYIEDRVTRYTITKRASDYVAPDGRVTLSLKRMEDSSFTSRYDVVRLFVTTLE